MDPKASLSQASSAREDWDAVADNLIAVIEWLDHGGFDAPEADTYLLEIETLVATAGRSRVTSTPENTLLDATNYLFHKNSQLQVSYEYPGFMSITLTASGHSYGFGTDGPIYTGNTMDGDYGFESKLPSTCGDLRLVAIAALIGIIQGELNQRRNGS